MSGPHAPDACRLRRASVCLGVRDDGYSSCAPCREVRRMQNALQRQKRRRRRNCLTCGDSAAMGRRYCERHLEYYRARDEARRAG